MEAAIRANKKKEVRRLLGDGPATTEIMILCVRHRKHECFRVVISRVVNLFDSFFELVEAVVNTGADVGFIRIYLDMARTKGDLSRIIETDIVSRLVSMTSRVMDNSSYLKKYADVIVLVITYGANPNQSTEGIRISPLGMALMMPVSIIAYTLLTNGAHVTRSTYIVGCEANEELLEGTQAKICRPLKTAGTSFNDQLKYIVDQLCV